MPASVKQSETEHTPALSRAVERLVYLLENERASEDDEPGMMWLREREKE